MSGISESTSLLNNIRENLSTSLYSLRSYNLSRETIAQILNEMNLTLEPILRTNQLGINKDYYIAYVRELKYHITEQNYNRLMSYTNNLTNTITREPQVVQWLIHIRQLNRRIRVPITSPFDTFMYTDYYKTNLERANVPIEKILLLVHFATLFLLSLLENDSMGDTNKDIVLRYIDLLEPYFTPSSIVAIRVKANELQVTNNNPVYITRAIQEIEQLRNGPPQPAPPRLQPQPATLQSRPQPQPAPQTINKPFASIPSMPKTPITSSQITDSKQISTICNEFIKDFQSPFKTLENKLKKICTKYTKPCDNLNEINTKLTASINKYGEQNFSILNANPDNKLMSLYNWYSRLNPTLQVKFTVTHISRIRVQYTEGLGIGIGVTRDFFQQCINELLEKEVFVYTGTEPVKRYQINPDFTTDKTFYTFIGKFLCFVLFNKIGLHFHLSNGILAHLRYKHSEITDDDYLGYFMLDNPDYFKTGYIPLLRDPDVIASVGLSFNDEYELKSMDEDVSKTNFREYITETAKYKLLSNNESLLALVAGFNEVRKFFAAEKVGLSGIDRLLTFETVNQETIRMLINQLRTNRQRTTEEQKRVVYDTMISILEDKGKTFPYDVLGKEPPKRSDSKARLRNFYEFIERLLSFWTGFRHYNETTNYALTVISKSDKTLPQSHTCFNLIDVPEPYHNDRNKLYAKLVAAVYLGENIVGLYGGGETVKYVAIFCANSDTIKEKSIVLMKNAFPGEKIIYVPMGTKGHQKCKVNVLSPAAVYGFLADEACSKLPRNTKFDAVIFENCPVLAIFEKEFFNEKTVGLWKNIVRENARFYLGFFTDKNLEGVDFSKHSISKYMKLTNHYKIMDGSKDLNAFEYLIKNDSSKYTTTNK